jgi:hypothetical protein
MGKKIGIVTFWRSEDNYGQLLQCYALQRFLKGMGQDVFLIKNTKDYMGKGRCGAMKRKAVKLISYLFHFRFIALYDKLCTLIQGIKYRWGGGKNRSYSRCFEEFRNKYIVSTAQEYTIGKLKKNPPAADIYICGSDQVWNATNPSPVYYLDFGEGCKRIAYAASFGGIEVSDIPEKGIRKMAYYLKRFDVITVREPKGIAICEKAGREDAKCVIDPTLLLSKSDYAELSQATDLPEKNYLLLYLLGNKTSLDIENVYRFAGDKDLSVVYVASQGRVDNYPKVYPTIEEWLFLVDHAEYVVTNSFHGTVFSIIMNKPFYTLPLTGAFEKMNERVETLLNKYGLSDRVGEFSSHILGKKVQYESVNEMLHADRVAMKQQMQDWLEGRP